jgi:hypothetical protein
VPAGLIGGSWRTALAALLWAGLVRVTVLQHVTWSVNSLCHVIGSRPFTTRRHDRATNLWPLALLSFGESWHNMHHVGADREAVRAGGAVPAGPGARRAPAGAADHHPVHRRAAPGVAADRDDADPVPGHHHPDNVSVDVSAVAYFRVVDAVKSVVAIENVYSAIDQIAQTTLRKVVGQHTLDQTLSETDKINLDIRKILDVSTVEWGVEVTLVELKDIQLPDSMKRAMAKQAEAEREKRAKIINAEGESLAAAALGDASDIMMAHPLALQLRNLQSLVEIGVDKNTTVVFPAPLMTTIAELGSFLAGEKAAAGLPAKARWPDAGREQSGVLTTAMAPGIIGAAAGARVPVWLDRSGQPAGPPGGHVGMIVDALAASAAVAAVAGITLLICYGLCRLVLDRRRLAAWESAWSLTGPRWTTRR